MPHDASSAWAQRLPVACVTVITECKPEPPRPRYRNTICTAAVSIGSNCSTRTLGFLDQCHDIFGFEERQVGVNDQQPLAGLRPLRHLWAFQITDTSGIGFRIC